MKKHLQLICYFFAQKSGLSLLIFICLLAGLAGAGAKNLSVSAAPAALTIAASSATLCAGTSTSLTVSGCPATGLVRWSTAQTGGSITVAPKQTTSYTATCEVTSTTATSSTITSTTGTVTAVTTTTATTTVLVSPPIVVALDTIPPLCNGGKDGMVVVKASGGSGVLQYQLNGTPFQKQNTFGSLRAGTYPLVVKDTAGCTVQFSVKLSQPQAISASVTIISTKCIGGADGAITAVGSGGSGDYRYSILDVTPTPQESGSFRNLKADTTYTLIVSDKNNCVLYKPIVITKPAPFVIKLNVTPTRCVGSADGSVAIAATGGSGTYQYQLGNGPLQTGTLFTGLAPATYEFTVQDVNGCQGKQSATVGQPAPLILTATPAPVNCLGPATGSITVSATGGTGAITYQLATSAPQTSLVFSGVTAGTYTVVGTDANGCTSLASATVGKTAPITLKASTIPATCCSCPTGAVKLTTTGGTGSGLKFQVIGQGYQAGSQINLLPPNTYRLRVVDDGGCTDSTTAVVTDKNAMTLTVGSVRDISCKGGLDGEATVQVTGGVKPFTYYWQTERLDTLKSRTATQTSIPEGTYTVSVRDSNRCTAATVFITIKALNPVPPKPVVSQVANSTLTVNQTAGVQWYVRTDTKPGAPVPNATGPSLVPFASGQYYVITTLNGCSSPPSEALNFILTALNEPATSLSVRVVPNPITDRLRLEIEQPERSAVQIQLLDASGRAVRLFQLPAFTGKKQAEWPLYGLPAGAYLVQVATETRRSVLRVGVE